MGRAEIVGNQIEPPFHLAIGVLGKTDRAGLCDPFQSRRDVDAVTHQVAVRLFDDVAQMNADAELDALFGRDVRIASDHVVLHVDRAAHCIDDCGIRR